MKTIKTTIHGLCAATALAAAMPSEAGSWQNNVSIGGFNSVHIYTPDTVSSIGDGKALLIVLHGCVQPINNYLTANLEDAADNHGMVIAVPDAANKAGYNCWSYWQGAINRSSGDYKNLIDLATTLSGDANRNIDAKQVYLAGLSSGGAFTQQAGCVAPDIFAGVAPSAGPTLGTSSNGALNNCEVVSPATFKSRCESYASSYSAHLSDQIAVVGHGTADTTVDTCYNQQNANGYAHTFGVSQLNGTNTIADDATRTASETLWQENRVAMLWFDGLDHSWSGGAGASGDYVAGNSINFADYLGAYFAANNIRVDRNSAPELSNVSGSDIGGQIQITGNAVDTETAVQSVQASIYAVDSGIPTLVDSVSGTAAANDGYFTLVSNALDDGLYEAQISATDDENKTSSAASLNVRVGPPPPATAPTLSNVNADVTGQCATITGTVVDVNLNLSNVSVAFDNGNKVASVNGNLFSAEQCSLPGGGNQAVVTASDDTNLSTSFTLNFNVDAGKTGDYNFHINEGHISWGEGYSACYLAFSTSEFTMREYAAGTNQCQWIADGEPSCKGPTQACSTPSQPTDSDSDGVTDSSDNCPNTTNSNQQDTDGDGIGDACDSTPNGETQDADSDGILDDVDNCPNVANNNQLDTDGDGLGDACDSTPNGNDADGDGILDSVDNCPANANPNQLDTDNDGLGDVCDSTPNGDFTCSEVTDNNYNHVQAGRATYSGGYALAAGSGDNLGLYNLFVTSTVAETNDGYFELGNCPSN